jgi:hypothetical protein
MPTEPNPALAADSSDLHPFDEAIRLRPLGEGRYGGRTHEAYRNMVGPYGGITAAVLLNALLQRPERLGDPVALTVNFAGPVGDGPFEIETQEIRTSRTTQHWFARQVQGEGDATVTTASAVFGLRRPTWSLQEASAPQLPSREQMADARSTISAPWSNRYERHTVEDLAAAEARSWFADNPPRPLDFAALASLCDAFRPWIFTRRRERTAIGTVSLNIYFHVGADELATVGSAPVKGRARTNVVRGGFFDQEAQVWSENDRLLATTQQVVWFKE